MSNKQVALQIINFLKTSVSDKQVGEDYVDSIDVAIDCLAEAFEVDRDDDSKVIDAEFQGKTLKDILSSFKAQSGVEVPVHVEEDKKEESVSEDTLKKAEELKLLGNKAMAARDFQEAIDKYTEALELTPKNAVYLSNRAAAYSSFKNHEAAVKDAEAAIEVDPTYSKAYSRLGLANYALNKPKESYEAYKKGLDVEGDNASPAMKRGYETAKARAEEQLGSSDDSTSVSREAPAATPGAGAGGLPDLSNLASMLGGGAGGAGGAPNFADMLNNPQLMQYAQQMMQNPEALNSLMNNPALKQMASQFGLGGEGEGSGSGPDLGSLLNNPALQNLAKDFMGGQK